VSPNIETVSRYLDGFRRNDHEQILSCLTDDIQWTVFGAFHLTGKEAYDKAIDGAPEFIDPPALEVVRMVEEGDVVRRTAPAVDHGPPPPGIKAIPRTRYDTGRATILPRGRHGEGCATPPGR
jgi:ketosteroid isomerase-like protein